MQENDLSILFHHNSVYLLKNSDYNSIVHNIINDKKSIRFADLDPSDNLFKITRPTDTLLSPTATPPRETISVSTIRRYATVNFKNIADTINFWHCALDHPDADIMINIFDANPSIRSLIPSVTNTNIRKIFPICPDCPVGNLQEKDAPFVPIVDDTPGSTFEFDLRES
jgi:hypothetical protein